MQKSDLIEIQVIIDNEGFDYVFAHYSDFKEIKDEKFHELRKQYLDSRIKLGKYLKLGKYF